MKDVFTKKKKNKLHVEIEIIDKRYYSSRAFAKLITAIINPVLRYTK